MTTRGQHHGSKSLGFMPALLALFLCACSSWLGNPPDTKGGSEGSKGTTTKVEIEKQATGGEVTVKGKKGSEGGGVSLTSAYVAMNDAFLGSVSPNPNGEKVIFDMVEQQFMPKSPSFLTQNGLGMTLLAAPADDSVLPEMAGLTVMIKGTFTKDGTAYPLDIRYAFTKALQPALVSPDILVNFSIRMKFNALTLFDFSAAPVDFADLIDPIASAITLSDESTDANSAAIKDAIIKNLEASFSYSKVLDTSLPLPSTNGTEKSPDSIFNPVLNK